MGHSVYNFKNYILFQSLLYCDLFFASDLLLIYNFKIFVLISVVILLVVENVGWIVLCNDVVGANVDRAVDWVCFWLVLRIVVVGANVVREGEVEVNIVVGCIVESIVVLVVVDAYSDVEITVICVVVVDTFVNKT